MDYYKYVVIAAGTITLMYVMLKVFSNLPESASEETEKSKDKKRVKEESDEPGKNLEIAEPHTNDNILNSAESQHKAVKCRFDDTSRAMKLPKQRPNFFVAFQVNNVEIHKKVKKIQEKLILKNPSLYSALVSVPTLHVTLAVTRLNNDEAIEIVKKKLDEWAAKNLEIFFNKPCVLKFTGIKTFSNSVAYVDIEPCDEYKRMCDLSKDMNSILSSAGYTTDKRNYTPHLTILKLSKDFRLLKVKKNFKDEFEALNKCTKHFGKQEIQSLQLLSMEEPRDKFGYYKCYHQIKVSDSNANMDHSECCSPIAKPKRFY